MHATVAAEMRSHLSERNCSVGRTIDVIGDGWSFMILRECYFGAARFEHFQRILGLPRTTLSNRLQRLVKHGLLDAQLYMTSPPRRDYRLSESGKALYPVLLSLMTFGDRWLSGADEKPLQLIHKVCNTPCSAIVVCPHCQKEIAARDVSYRDGPGAGLGPIPQDRNSRRTSDPTALERTRPSSVARTYKVIGDRWSFRILRAAFFKFRRFDELQTELGIAPNILSERLYRLVAEGIFTRVQYRTGPDRFEYRLTDKGKDLFGPIIAMLGWGDEFLSGGSPPLILQHQICGQEFSPAVVCDHCHTGLRAREMAYKMNYRDPLN